jgi:protein TonB
LYKSEWLDLVFDKRNKDYGAYNIRQHYAQNLTRALLISIAGVVGGALALGAAIKVEPPTTIITPVDLIPITPPPSSKAKEEPVKPKVEKPAKAATPVETKRFVEMVATANPPEIEPPTLIDLQTAVVGSVNVEGPAASTGANVEPVTTGSGGGAGPDITESNVPVSTAVLSVMPTPVGGDAAWTKFLMKNLRYPDQAVEAEKGGKVWITFVIEKDGTLTDVKVMKGVGYGMDEEALRVLKKAPAWKPGIMSGRPVRVQFTLPINFALQ